MKKPAFNEMRLLQHMKSAKRNLSKIDFVKRMSLVKHEPQVLQCRSRDIQSQQWFQLCSNSSFMNALRRPIIANCFALRKGSQMHLCPWAALSGCRSAMDWKTHQKARRSDHNAHSTQIICLQILASMYAETIKKRMTSLQFGQLLSATLQAFSPKLLRTQRLAHPTLYMYSQIDTLAKLQIDKLAFLRTRTCVNLQRTFNIKWMHLIYNRWHLPFVKYI